jgi:alpha-glucosidase
MKEIPVSDLLDLTSNTLFEGLRDASPPQSWQQSGQDCLMLTYPEGKISISIHDGGFIRLEILCSEGRDTPPAPQRDGRSWAIEKEPSRQPFRLEEEEGLVRMRHGEACVEVDKAAGSLRFRNGAGELFLHQKGAAFALSKELLTTSFHTARKEPFLGLGEKSGNLDRRGRTWEMWNSDEPKHTPEKDPLYVSIPLLYRLAEKGSETDGQAIDSPAGRAPSEATTNSEFAQTVTALFLDEPGRSYFDLADRQADSFTLALPLSRMVLWIWEGETVKEVQEKWITLSGKPPMPPLWSLGYHQSRYSYYSSEEVLEIARQFRRRKIPCDVIHLDIDYMDRYRVFTWNSEAFPSPEGLTASLGSEGFRVVTIIDPGVGIDDGSDKDAYQLYREGEHEGLFLKNPDGSSYIGAVWPGKAAFPDFTRPEVRSWWARWAVKQLNLGVAGIWNDMNEPADFTGHKWIRKEFTLPDSTLSLSGPARAPVGEPGEISGPQAGYRTGAQAGAGAGNGDGVGDGEEARAGAPVGAGAESEVGAEASAWAGEEAGVGAVPFRELHNIYGQGMCMATRDAARAARPDQRSFVLSRAGFAGIQRYAALWTGDNNSWWEHMAMSIPMLLGLGISGVPFVGADAGGFQSNADGELFARWIAYAAFTPFFRGHSACETRPHEPWAFGKEVEKAAKRAIEGRYQLLPYTYSLFAEASRTGAPVMRPLFWEFPRDPESANVSDQYLYGPEILVAPITTPGRKARAVLLPPGEWEDFHTGHRYRGGQYILADAPLEILPLFIRIGAIIPCTGVKQHTDDGWWRELELHIYLPEEKREEESTEPSKQGDRGRKQGDPIYRGSLILPADDGISIPGVMERADDETSVVKQLIYSCSLEMEDGKESLLVSVEGKPGALPGLESGFREDDQGFFTRDIDLIIHLPEGKREDKKLLVGYDVEKGYGSSRLQLSGQKL